MAEEKGRGRVTNKLRGGWLMINLNILILIILCVLYSISFFEVRGDSYENNIYNTINRDPVGDPIGKPTLEPESRHLHTGEHVMVSSDVPLCSSMGKSILESGGNAADAAVTVALCIGSINSHSSGIGGGGFILSSQAQSGQVLSIDAREMAPIAAFRDMYNKNPMLSQFGGLAIAVPGELKGLYELYSRHGSGNLTWKQLFEPVIELNEKGFKCSLYLSRAINLMNDIAFSKLPEIAHQWDFIFRHKEDKLEPIKEGDLITRRSYAKSLRLIAQNNSADIFYDPEGPIASSILKVANKFGGILTKEDFRMYRVHVEDGLSLNFTASGTNYTIFTSGGVSSGLALLAGLNVYQNLNTSTEGIKLDIHKLIESMKWMASARSNFGDFLAPENESYRSSLIEKYTSDSWAKNIASTKYSDLQTFDWKHYKPHYELTEPHGTSHFSVIDSKGNGVSMTTTINLPFGSLVYDNETGIILNNEMDDFSIPNFPNAFNLTPSVYNYIHPGKRPISSTSPSIIFSSDNQNRNPELLIGAAGGSRITTAVFQAIIRTLFQNHTLLNAISNPRVHHQLIPEYTMIEDVAMYNDETDSVEFLESLGHSIYESGPMTTMNGIRRTYSGGKYIWEGVSDYWRKAGEADGF